VSAREVRSQTSGAARSTPTSATAATSGPRRRRRGGWVLPQPTEPVAKAADPGASCTEGRGDPPRAGRGHETEGGRRGRRSDRRRLRGGGLSRERSPSPRGGRRGRQRCGRKKRPPEEQIRGGAAGAGPGARAGRWTRRHARHRRGAVRPCSAGRHAVDALQRGLGAAGREGREARGEVRDGGDAVLGVLL
jgi:hypothetical protein